MKTSLYKQALQHGWWLTRHHLWLWPLGLFASLLGQMGLLEFFTKIVEAGSGTAPTWSTIPQLFQFFNMSWPHLSWSVFGWSLWLIVVFVSLFVLFVFVAVVSQGAIIHAASKAVHREVLADVGKAWHVGVRHFWSLFFINLFKKILIGILAVLVFWATKNVMQYSRGWDAIWFLLMFLIAAVTGMVLSFLAIYAAGYVVVEQYSFGRSIVAAWKLVWRHWLPSIEAAIVIFAVDIVAFVLVLVGFFVFMFPSLFLWILAVVTVNATLYMFATIFGMLLLALFIIFVGSVLTVFVTSTWIFLFMRMHHSGVKSTIIRWLSA